MEKNELVQLVIPLVIILTAISFSGCADGVERTDWAFEKSQMDEMNDRGMKGEGVTIGIVDTGLNVDHPDLKKMNVVAWRDFVDGRADPYDDRGHGTHVAGIIGANGDLKGGAPEADFVIAKVLNQEGESGDGTVADAIDWCVDEGADVICLSLGGDALIPRLGEESGQAARDAISRGVVVVAAAGNDGEDPDDDDDDVKRPANVDGVIAVGAVDRDLKIASFSESGNNEGPTPLPFDDRQDPDKKPEVVAPGVKIRSTYLRDDYAIMSGTSQATPFVVAGVALMLEEHPDFKRDGANGGDSQAVENIKEAIMNGAYKINGQDKPHDDHYGYGLFKAADSSDRL